ncbi:Dynein light chain LC6 [Nymphaea thermarum]|nr:Dynein light chain LC6 [Nymphaea thermarum]
MAIKLSRLSHWLVLERCVNRNTKKALNGQKGSWLFFWREEEAAPATRHKCSSSSACEQGNITGGDFRTSGNNSSTIFFFFFFPVSAEKDCEDPSMLEGRALIQDTDMPTKMQIHAMTSASHALDLYDVLDCKSIAAHIKKVRFSSLFNLSVVITVRFSRVGFSVFFPSMNWALASSVVLQEFDAIYGSGWQCVVGFNFGCFFTHSEGTFIYFCLETLRFLIFKGAGK